MDAIRATLAPILPYLPYAGAVGVMFIVGVMSVSTLIPLDSVPAVSGVTIITAIAYATSIVMWLVAILYFGTGPDATERLTWLNTHLLWLVVFPTTIAATAMNVTTVQNTRNLLAGRVTA
jgi:hypothetical protein